jgi:hypothetical protein
MAAKLGSDDVSFRLGAGEVAAVYLGSQQVWSAATVPGAPTIFEAAFAFGDTTVSVASPNSNGGSPITSFNFYFEGSDSPTAPDELRLVGENDQLVTEDPLFAIAIFSPDYTGQEVRASAVNAIGEGPKSAPVTVTAAE